jgi:hypothetical protein
MSRFIDDIPNVNIVAFLTHHGYIYHKGDNNAYCYSRDYKVQEYGPGVTVDIYLNAKMLIININYPGAEPINYIIPDNVCQSCNNFVSFIGQILESHLRVK